METIGLYGFVSAKKINKIPCCRKLLFCAQALRSIIQPICCLQSQGLIGMSQNIIVPFLCNNYAFEVPCECDRSVAICQQCLFNVNQEVWIRREYSSTVWLTFVRTCTGLRNGTSIKCFAQVRAKPFFKGTFHQHGKSWKFIFPVSLKIRCGTKMLIEVSETLQKKVHYWLIGIA